MGRLLRVRILALLLSASALVVGCSEGSALEDLSSGEEVFFSFVVGDLSEGTVGASGSDATRSTYDDNTIASVQNMWVVQYNSSDAYVASRYFDTFTSTDGVVIDSNTSTIIFIANTFSSSLITPSNAASISSLKSLTYTTAAGNDAVLGGSDNKYCIMSGSITDYNPASIPNITLSRNCAKINVYIDDSGLDGYTLQNIYTDNIPDKSYYYTNYDAISSITSAGTSYNYDYWDSSGLSSAKTTSGYTFYLPINQQGTQSNNISSAKPTHAPTNATSIVLLYKATSGTAERSYTFYLGANMTSDYNLRPNCGYNYTFTITMGNSTTDPRIEALNN